jgi:dihydrofolate synthase/folylpolyglutamate synthase
MAFQWFADEGVDIAVIETGLGGRLDSTNVILPVLSVITNISFDHKDLLGDTLPKIAQEKAGIIKQDTPVIIGEQHEETERVFFEHSVRKQSPLYYAQSSWDLAKQGTARTGYAYKAIHKLTGKVYDLETDLAGNYQVHNLKTILTVADHLAILGYDKITQQTAQNALRNVQGTTGLMGRWQVLTTEPLVICDVAHNPAGLREVFAQWESTPARRKHIIAGFVRDKDVTEALRLFPGDAAYYFTNATIPRALPAEELQCLAAEAGLMGPAYGSVGDALDAATTKMEPGDALLITGSFFIVGEAIAAYKPV